MFIELQLASVPFTQFLRNMLRQRLAMQPCIDDTFPYMGETFMVDYLHIDRTTSLRTPNGSASVNQTGEAGAVPITARQTQIAQRLIVHLTTLEALRATSRGEPPRDVTPSRMVFEVVFSIQLTVVAGAAQLVMNFVDILPFDIVARAIPPSELDRIRAAVRMRVPAITSTLNLGALTTLLGARQLLNAGISVSPGVSLAMALEFDDGSASLSASVRGAMNAARVSMWTRFYASGSTQDSNPIQSDGWALFVHASVLTHASEETLQSALAGSSELHLATDTPARATWTASPSGGVVPHAPRRLGGSAWLLVRNPDDDRREHDV